MLSFAIHRKWEILQRPGIACAYLRCRLWKRKKWNSIKCWLQNKSKSWVLLLSHHLPCTSSPWPRVSAPSIYYFSLSPFSLILCLLSVYFLFHFCVCMWSAHACLRVGVCMRPPEARVTGGCLSCIYMCSVYTNSSPHAWHVLNHRAISSASVSSLCPIENWPMKRKTLFPWLRSRCYLT